MKAPICFLCHTKPGAGQASANPGDWIAFANYRPLPEGVMGHPDGLEWFCAAHVEAARALSAKTSTDALLALQAAFGQFAVPPPPEAAPGVASRLAQRVNNVARAARGER